MARLHPNPCCRVAAVAAVIAMAGCASRDPLASWQDRGLAERVATLRRQGQLPPEEPALPDADAASQPASADDAWHVDRAMAGNAEIRSARQKVERLREQITQVLALPDPMATVTFGELAQTAAGQVQYIVGVQQSLPFPGTLEARAEVVRQQVEEALGELQMAVQRVSADVRRAYWSGFVALREGQILRQNRQLLEQIQSTVQARARVNKARQDDLLRISRRLAAIDNRIAAADQRRHSAQAVLNQLLGRSGGGSLPQVEAREPWSMSLDRDQLFRAARQTSPPVRVAQARAATYRSRLRSARLERLPDFMVGAQYGAVRDGGLSQMANGDDQVAGTLGVTIPLWSGRYDAAEREALRGMGEAIASVRAAQDRAVFETDDADAARLHR